MHEFENFNYKFSITTTDTAPAELRSSFIEEMNQIDNIMINHYLSLEFIKKIYFVLTQEDVNIGYGCGVIENGFLTIYELFVLPKYRELGFGTKIFNEIRTFTDTSNLKIRSYRVKIQMHIFPNISYDNALFQIPTMPTDYLKNVLI